ncbi:MAG: T9SS type A sorting domain-containing protein [Cytophagales bacterium]
MLALLKKLVFIYATILMLTAQLASSQTFLATNLVSSSGNIVETDCYITTWTVGEVALISNASIISGQQAYAVKKITPTVITESASLCSGQEYKLTAKDSVYFDSIQWYFNDIKIAGATKGIFKPSVIGAYSYKLWNENSLCKYSSNTVNVSVPDFQTPTISASGSPVNTLTTNPAVSYQWFANNRLIAGQTAQNYSVRYNGSYHVLVTYANGCKATSTVFVVNESDYIDITRSGALITDNTIYFGHETRKLSIIPNAIKESETANIQFHTQSEWAKYTVYNADGKTIFEGNFSDDLLLKTASFNTGGLKSGTYFVKAFDSKGTQLEKLIIFR